MTARSKRSAQEGFNPKRSKTVRNPWEDAAATARMRRAIDLHLGGDSEQAESMYSALLAEGYKDSLLFSNLATIKMRLGFVDEAVKMFRHSLRLDPLNPDTCNNLGVALKASGKLQEAVHLYRRAVELRPDFPPARRNLAYALLQIGEYDEGWREHEWRLRIFAEEGLSRQLAVVPRCPQWDGKPDPAIHLLIVAEQGLGDMLQFVRYVPFMRAIVGRFSLCVPEKLAGLLQHSGLVNDIYLPSTIPADPSVRWLPLMSLPLVLGAIPQKPRPAFPYLRIPEDRLNYWRQRIRGKTPLGPIIGINWQGNPKTEETNLQGRSLRLEQFSILTGIPGIRFASLQKGMGSEQLERCSFRELFVACQDEISRSWDFIDTAAMVSACHLVVTCDTAMAHLSGALGCPTWILLQKYPDWRWGLEGSQTHWYPSARLFRQRHQGDWAPVLSEVFASLASCTQHV